MLIFLAHRWNDLQGTKQARDLKRSTQITMRIKLLQIRNSPKMDGNEHLSSVNSGKRVIKTQQGGNIRRSVIRKKYQ